MKAAEVKEHPCARAARVARERAVRRQNEIFGADRRAVGRRLEKCAALLRAESERANYWREKVGAVKAENRRLLALLGRAAMNGLLQGAVGPPVAEAVAEDGMVYGRP